MGLKTTTYGTTTSDFRWGLNRIGLQAGLGIGLGRRNRTGDIITIRIVSLGIDNQLTIKQMQVNLRSDIRSSHLTLSRIFMVIRGISSVAYTIMSINAWLNESV